MGAFSNSCDVRGERHHDRQHPGMNSAQPKTFKQSRRGRGTAQAAGDQHNRPPSQSAIRTDGQVTWVTGAAKRAPVNGDESSTGAARLPSLLGEPDYSGSLEEEEAMRDLFREVQEVCDVKPSC